MGCKLKYGDSVVVISSPSLHKGKIISVKLQHSGTYRCKVEFNNRFLMPNEMDYNESELELEFARAVGGCPVCKTAWTVTKFGKKTWKDCDKCGKTEEDLLATKDKNGNIKSDFTDCKTHPPGAYVNGNKDPNWTKELEEEFEKLLGITDDGDDWDAPGEIDDDFGFYQP